MIALRINYVTNSTMQVLKDVFRRHPDFIDHFLPFFNRGALEQITEPSGRSSFVWIVG